jgi:hypothetical protein
MRTSNKILSGLLLTAIILFASLFITVRVKYANGAITKRATINNWSDVHRIKEPIKSVRISRLSNILIIPADSVRLDIWKENDGAVKWRVQDGVLIIESDTTKANRHGEHYAFGHVELFIPNVDSVYMEDSRGEFKRILDTMQLNPIYNFQLNRTVLNVRHDPRGGTPTFYELIHINAGPSSAVHFDEAVRVANAAVSLQGASFEDNNASFDKLSIRSDSSSSINIKGHNLRKATITSTE